MEYVPTVKLKSKRAINLPAMFAAAGRDIAVKYELCASCGSDVTGVRDKLSIPGLCKSCQKSTLS